MCPQGGSAQGRLFSVRPFRLPGGFASCCVTGWVIELALMRLMTAAAAPDASHAAFALRWGIVCIGAGVVVYALCAFAVKAVKAEDLPAKLRRKIQKSN